MVLGDGKKEILPRGEVLRDGPERDAGAFGYLRRGRLDATLVEQRGQRLHDRGSRPLRSFAPPVELHFTTA